MGNTLSGDVAGLTGGVSEGTEGAQAEGAPEAAAGAESQLSAEMQAVVTAQVKDAVEKAREEWEGPGGPMGKMQSTLEKRISRLKAKDTQASQARRQQAVALMESEPEEAARLLAAELDALDAGTEIDQRTTQATEWVEHLMSDIGYNMDDDAVAEKAAGYVQTLVTQPHPDVPFDVQQQIGRERTEALLKENKELRKVKEQLPDLIRTEVTRLMAEGGGPEITTPGGASHKNPIKDITSPTVLLTAAFEDVVKKKS